MPAVHADIFFNFVRMARISRYLIVLLFLGTGLQAQLKTVKPVPPKKKASMGAFGIFANFTNSALLLQRNVKSDNNAIGFGGGCVFTLSRLLRLSGEATTYQNINIAPTWFNVKASTLEFNLQAISRTKDANAFFYPFFGLSYNVFKGFYTGTNDALHLYRYFPANTSVRTHWLGVNSGIGFEYFIKHFSFFGEFKLRFGLSYKEHQFNVMDVCYGAGLRYTFRTLPFYRLFKGTRSRYFLDKSGD